MGLDPRLAQEILAAVDARFYQLQRGMPYTLYGTVATVDTVNLKASVYLSGDTTASAGFSFPAGMQPAVGARVRVVIDPRGDRYIDSHIDPRLSKFLTDQIQIPSTVDATSSSTGHPFQIGNDGGQNLRIDNNEIMSLDNGAFATLFLQKDGGTLGIFDALLTQPLAGILDFGAIQLNQEAVEPLEGIDLRSGSSAGTNYPQGISLMRITDGSGTGVGAGWPLSDGRGTVLTISNTTTLIHQIWMQRGSQGGAMYGRNWRGDTSAWRAWVQII